MQNTLFSIEQEGKKYLKNTKYYHMSDKMVIKSLQVMTDLVAGCVNHVQKDVTCDAPLLTKNFINPSLQI